MNLYRRRDSPYWWADLRRYGLGQVSTKQADRDMAERATINYLAENHATLPQLAGTITELCNRYLAWSRTNHTDKVYIRNKHLLALFLAHCRAETHVGQITAGTIEDFKATRRVRPATINRDLNTIRHLFKQAVDWGYLRDSPARSVKRMRAQRPIPRFYSQKEIKSILDASEEPWRSIWLVALNTGMRLGEICGLTWKDIKDGHIRVLASKEGREKHIPVSVQLAGILGQIQRNGDRIVPSSPAGISMKFRRLTGRLGIGGSFHTLRHSVATHLLLQGVPIQVVSRLLGHASISTTSIYSHALAEHLAHAVEKMRSVTEPLRK